MLQPDLNSPGRRREIRKGLLRWYGKSGRDLPWRKTRDPYAIWISEIMLQQTQVTSVIPYYQRFLRAFPTVRRLAEADLSKVLKAWEGLGYYSRARNLHLASRIILDRFDGKIPDSLEGLVSLPGVGRSTAGAILSFAFGKAAPILDGNAKRVLSRLFAVSEAPGGSDTEKRLWRLAESLTPEKESNPFNQALMDLGATLCSPRNPQCLLCPLLRPCAARAGGDPEKYPGKKKKRDIPHLQALSAVLRKNGKVLLRRRPLDGLLGGLWEFPSWEIKDQEDQERRLRLGLRTEAGIDAEVKEPMGTFYQTFTHFKLTLHVFGCRVVKNGKKGKKAEKGEWVSVKELGRLPMSRIHRKIADALGGR